MARATDRMRALPPLRQSRSTGQKISREKGKPPSWQADGIKIPSTRRCTQHRPPGVPAVGGQDKSGRGWGGKGDSLRESEARRKKGGTCDTTHGNSLSLARPSPLALGAKCLSSLSSPWHASWLCSLRLGSIWRERETFGCARRYVNRGCAPGPSPLPGCASRRRLYSSPARGSSQTSRQFQRLLPYFFRAFVGHGASASPWQ